MLQLVNVGQKSLGDYATIATRGLMDEIRRLAEQLEDDYDFVIVHDPQPAAMIEHFPSSPASWIWRCHIDLSQPNPAVLEFLLPWIARYDAAIFHMPEYVPRVSGLPPAYIWPPA